MLIISIGDILDLEDHPYDKICAEAAGIVIPKTRSIDGSNFYSSCVWTASDKGERYENGSK